MLPFLILNVQSKLKDFTADMYNKEFSPKKKGNNRVWCFLVYKPYVKGLKSFEVALEQSKILTNGSIAYGKINCQAEQRLCEKLHLETFPSILIKNRTYDINYQEQPNPVRIAKEAFMIVNSSLVEEVNDFWIDDYRSKPTAILFTRKKGIPGYWAAISRVYNKKIRVGICHDDGLYDEFGVTTVPQIVFYNGDKTVPHEGSRKFRFVNETANAFLNDRQSKSPIGADFHVNAEFPEYCYDYTKTCIFRNDEFIDPDLDELRNRFRDPKFHFFIGKSDFPFKNIKEGAVVIYNAKKGGIIVEEDIHKAQSAIDRVIDGTAKFKSISKEDISMEL